MRHASAEAIDFFGNVESYRKGPGEGLVTEVDKSLERFFRERIQEEFPGDFVIGEEFTTRNDPGGGIRWYVDPIDGTAAYSMSLPVWTICLALAEDEVPDAGLMLAPVSGEEYYGVRQGDSFKNGQRIEGRSEPLNQWDDESLLCVTSDVHRRFKVDFVGKCRSLGSSAYHMGLVVDGRAVGALMGTLHVWDLAAIYGLSDPNQFDLRTLDGGKPDWSSLAMGAESQNNLLFAQSYNMDDLLSRIEVR